jgi:hypothetical protein
MRVENDEVVALAEEIDQRAAVAQATIERLAHQKWERRGRPLGSPEQDWFEAELELRPALALYIQAEARASTLARESVACDDDDYYEIYAAM